MVDGAFTAWWTDEPRGGTSMIKRLTRSIRQHGKERGASLVEYALLVALIAVVCIGAVTVLGKNSSTKMQGAGESIGGNEPCAEVTDADNPMGGDFHFNPTLTTPDTLPGLCP